MKVCQKCGCENNDESKFCKRCGGKLEERVSEDFTQEMGAGWCPRCGEARMQGQQFCTSCGYPFSGGEGGMGGQAEPPADKAEKRAPKKRRWIIPVMIILVLVIAGIDIFLYREEIAGFFGGSAGENAKTEEDGRGAGDEPVAEEPGAETPAEEPGTEPIAEEPEPAAEEQERSFTYAVYLGDFTWEEARRQCEALGGQLATIYSQEEMTAIEQALAQSGIGPSTATGQYRYFWIGGTRMNNPEGDYYYWIDDTANPPANLNGGDPDIYAAWGTDSPSFMWNNNGTIYNEDCMVLGYDEGQGRWIWNDVANDPYGLNGWAGTSRMGYICQFEN